MRILCDEPTSEAGREVRQAGREVRQVFREFRQEAVEGQTSRCRSQRTRNMFARLHEYVITSDDMVDDEGELVHYTFYADTDLVNATEAFKDLRWMRAMMDEIKSTEDNDTWPLVELPKWKT